MVSTSSPNLNLLINVLMWCMEPLKRRRTPRKVLREFRDNHGPLDGDLSTGSLLKTGRTTIWRGVPAPAPLPPLPQVVPGECRPDLPPPVPHKRTPIPLRPLPGHLHGQAHPHRPPPHPHRRTALPVRAVPQG
ncbi:unnamed protein product, partial [Ixodes persulcatus]